MGKTFIGAASALLLFGCTAKQQDQVNTALATQPGQLFCQIAAGAGPLVVAAVDKRLSGSTAGAVAVIATDKSVAYVNAACAQAGGVPVSPPADAAAAPKVVVTPPAGA